MKKETKKSKSQTSIEESKVEITGQVTNNGTEESLVAPIDSQEAMQHLWNKYPDLMHLAPGSSREKLEARIRLKKIRYMLYRLRTQTEKNEPLDQVEGLLPGFIEFWLNETPVYAIDPRGQRILVPVNKQLPVSQLGAYGSFAQTWDVDEELMVYVRHASVWQEWNAILHRVVPVLGE